jgi:transposase-like protein
LKSLIIDGNPAFFVAWENYFARVPLQLCRVHVERRSWLHVPKTGDRGSLAADLRSRVRHVIYAPTYEQSLTRLYALTDQWHRFKGLMPPGYDPIASLLRLHAHHVAHYRTHGLPADANITENVIRQLNKKIRPMEGFATQQTADHYLRLLIGCYQAKAFTDSRASQRNGKSPLEIAGVNLAGRDWLGLIVDP